MVFLKRTGCLAFLLALTGLLTAQNNYFVKDSVLSVGVRILNCGAVENARHCCIKPDNLRMEYSPEEVSEYGLSDDRVYFSRIITADNEEKKVFLERLDKGLPTLHFYKNSKGRHFYFEGSDGRLVEFRRKGNPEGSFRDFLRAHLPECDAIREPVRLVRYARPGIQKVIRRYHACSRRPFPFIRYGVTAGFSQSKPANLKSSDSPHLNAAFNPDRSFNAGIFADIPITLCDFSFHPELYFQKNSFVSHYVGPLFAHDMYIDATSLNMPLLVRYTVPFVRVRPFINAGAIFTWNFRNRNVIYTTQYSAGQAVYFETDPNTFYGEIQTGYVIGGGILVKIDYRRAASLEIRYFNGRGLDEWHYGSRGFQCCFSICL